MMAQDPYSTQFTCSQLTHSCSSHLFSQAMKTAMKSSKAVKSMKGSKAASLRACKFPCVLFVILGLFCHRLCQRIFFILVDLLLL